MTVKKRVFIAFVLFMSIISHRSFAAVYDGIESFSKVETKHFSIIFTDKSSSWASIVQKEAEIVYGELCDLFGFEENGEKIEVVIVDDEKRLNAFYSPFVNSHIVLYNAPLVDGDLKLMSNPPVDVFRHELTHYLLNERCSGDLKGFKKFFGPWLTPTNFISLPYLMLEGMAVFAESRSETGRLNNPFAYHSIRESILEQSFPQANQFYGSSEIYNDKKNGYVFGGAFIEYLYEKYGKEKFHSFIKKLESLNTLNSALMKTYHKSVNDLWLEFASTCVYPKSLVNPVNFVNDSGYYKNFMNIRDEFWWADLTRKKIYRYTKKGIRPFMDLPSGFSSFSVSDDLSYLSVSTIFKNDIETKIYDIKNNFKVINKLKNIYKTSITENGAIWGIKEENSSYSLVSVNNYVSFEYSLCGDIIPFNIKAIDDKNVAFIGVQNNKFNLYILQIEGEEKQIVLTVDLLDKPYIMDDFSLNVLPDGTYDMYISAQERVKFNKLNSFPFVLKIELDPKNIDAIKVYRQTSDTLGGIFSPYRVKDSIYFIKRMYEDDFLSTVLLEDLKLEQQNVVVESRETFDLKYNSEFLPKNKKNMFNSKLKVSSYSKFLNMFKPGSFIPLLFVNDLNTYSVDQGAIGVSYLMADATESWNMFNSFGWDVKKSILKYSIGIGQSALPLNTTLRVTPYYSFANKIFSFDVALLTRYEKILDERKSILSVFDFGWDYRDFLFGDIGIRYQDYIKVGKSPMESRYLIAQAFGSYDNKNFVGVLQGSYHHPRMFPVSSSKTLTYSFPFTSTLDIRYISSSKDLKRIDNYFLTSLGFSFTLLRMDIQKNVSNEFLLFVNSIEIRPYAALGFKWYPFVSKGDDSNRLLMPYSFGSEILFDITPSFLGIVPNSAKFTLGVRLNYSNSYVIDGGAQTSKPFSVSFILRVMGGGITPLFAEETTRSGSISDYSIIR